MSRLAMEKIAGAVGQGVRRHWGGVAHESRRRAGFLGTCARAPVLEIGEFNLRFSI